MTHHITDEQIDALCLGLTGTFTRKERDRAVARAVLALAAPAPAVPSDEREAFIYWLATTYPKVYSPSDAAQYWDNRHVSALAWQRRAALTAAPTPPAHSKCLTCNGHGLIGGHMQDGSGYGEGCPGCNPEPAVPEDVARLDALGTPGWELSMNDDPECGPDELWQVHRVSGGRNDREWTLIGSGANPRTAIDAARKAGSAA